MANVVIVKANGEKEEFKPDKLRDSLARSGASVEEINGVLGHIESELVDGMTTREIYKHAFDVLKREDKGAAGLYSLRESILQFGPSGFPFETFVAELFKKKGYDAHSGEQVPGKCIEHEVDIVACRNGDTLVMAEAKFHNEYGKKSDVQDALYTKARFDDIQGGEFQYYGCSLLHEGWLVTNTKFSSMAIDYAECVGLTLLGWNYPRDNGLEVWIQETGLIPLTCLTTLSQKQKKLLIDKDIVLTGSIKDSDAVLHEIGMNNEDVEATMEEVHVIARNNTHAT